MKESLTQFFFHSFLKVQYIHAVKKALSWMGFSHIKNGALGLDGGLPPSWLRRVWLSCAPFFTQLGE